MKVRDYLRKLSVDTKRGIDITDEVIQYVTDHWGESVLDAELFQTTSSFRNHMTQYTAYRIAEIVYEKTGV